MLDHADVLALLGRQHWVATRDQLFSAGLSETALRRAIRAGSLAKVSTQVVRLAAAPDSFLTRCMQLDLACGDDAYLSGPTSARILGTRGMPEYPIEVTIAHARSKAVPAWARVVRSSWLDPELHRMTHESGLAIATPLRTLMRIGEIYGSVGYGRTKFRKAAEDLWHRELITPEAAREFLEASRRSGRGGVAVFDEWLGEAASRRRAAQSNQEVGFADALTAWGLPVPSLQHPITTLEGITYHADIAYPNVRLAVEPGHEWWHGGNDGKRADERRDRELTEVGWETMRFDSEELKDMDRCVHQVARVYYQRWRGGRGRAETAVA